MIINIAFKYLSPIFILGQKLIKTFPFHKDLREPEKQDRPCPRQRTGTAPAGENTSRPLSLKWKGMIMLRKRKI